MNDFSLKDDDLSALEAQLLGNGPKLDPVRQQMLIYQCAFDAGKRSGRRSLRIWQTGALTLALMLVASQYPWNRPVAPLPSGERTTQIAIAAKEEMHTGVFGTSVAQPSPRETWKSQENKEELFDREWQKFARLDPSEKAHALIRFSQGENRDY
jgi:hypothetical protein